MLQVYSWTDEMAVLMRAADIVVGKPGGLTVSESLACGRPFIASCSVGGQEACNVRFLERYGIGCRLEPEELPGRLRELFENPSELVAWQTRAAEQAPRRSAMAVADLIERCARHADLQEFTGSRALPNE